MTVSKKRVREAPEHTHHKLLYLVLGGKGLRNVYVHNLDELTQDVIKKLDHANGDTRRMRKVSLYNADGRLKPGWRTLDKHKVHRYTVKYKCVTLIGYE